MPQQRCRRCRQTSVSSAIHDRIRNNKWAPLGSERASHLTHTFTGGQNVHRGQLFSVHSVNQSAPQNLLELLRQFLHTLDAIHSRLLIF